MNTIKRRAYRRQIDDVGVNHGRLQVFVSEQILYGPYISSSFKQMSCKRMPGSMRTHWLMNARQARCFFDCLLHARFKNVMPAYSSAAGIGGEACGRENILHEFIIHPEREGDRFFRSRRESNCRCQRLFFRRRLLSLRQIDRDCLARFDQILRRDHDLFALLTRARAEDGFVNETRLKEGSESRWLPVGDYKYYYPRRLIPSNAAVL